MSRSDRAERELVNDGDCYICHVPTSSVVRRPEAQQAHSKTRWSAVWRPSPEVQARLFQAWLLERMVRESRRAAATSAAEARRLTHVEARSYIFALGDRRGRLPLAAGSSLWKSPFSRRR